MSNGDQTGLVTNQQPIGQPAQTTQPAQQPMNLHQLFGTMTADQALKLKSGVIRHKQQKEIIRNVGTERAESLINDYKNQGLSISAALAQSKKELSPISKELDNLYFKEGVTPDKFLALRKRKGTTFTKSERNLWFSHYNSLLRKENNELIKAGKISKVAGANFEVTALAQADYNMIQSEIERSIKGYFETDDYGQFIQTKDGNLKYKMIDSEEKLEDGSTRKIRKAAISPEDAEVLIQAKTYIDQAMTSDLSGQPSDQREMQRQLSVIANLVPIEYLKQPRGIFVGDEWIDTYGRDYNESTLRRLFFDGLNRNLLRVKDHLAKYDYSTTGQETETDEEAGQTGQIDYSQYEIPTRQ